MDTHLSDQELNEAVARKMGHQIATKEGLHIMGKDGFVYDMPAYSTDIEAAWEIVKYLESKVKEMGNTAWGSEADTAPRAICEAFLKLCE